MNIAEERLQQIKNKETDFSEVCQDLDVLWASDDGAVIVFEDLSAIATYPNQDPEIVSNVDMWRYFSIAPHHAGFEMWQATNQGIWDESYNYGLSEYEDNNEWVELTDDAELPEGAEDIRGKTYDRPDRIFVRIDEGSEEYVGFSKVRPVNLSNLTMRGQGQPLKGSAPRKGTTINLDPEILARINLIRGEISKADIINAILGERLNVPQPYDSSDLDLLIQGKKEG